MTNPTIEEVLKRVWRHEIDIPKTIQGNEEQLEAEIKRRLDSVIPEALSTIEQLVLEKRMAIEVIVRNAHTKELDSTAYVDVVPVEAIKQLLRGDE